MENQSVRLQKFLSQAGICSRRQGEIYIKEGKESVNGSAVYDMVIKINPETDIIKFNGKTVDIIDKKVYIALNKPKNIVTTLSDQFGRKSVVDLLSDYNGPRVYPVGRLDYDSEGLLILTNDGDLTYKLTHPGNIIYKTYIVTLDKAVNKTDLMPFSQGMVIDNYKLAPAKYKILDKNTVEVKIFEGRNRQIRKMFDCIGYKVKRLIRISVADVTVDDLKPGNWRFLTDMEVNILLNC